MGAKLIADTTQMSLSLQPERQVYRVSELNAALQRVFERDFRSVWVAGEISGCRTASSGHYYFSLKDDQSQLKCALFRGAARFAKFRPQDGLAVIARGNLEVYEARGEYQLIVELLEPQGAGALQLAFEQLKRKLAAEGLFDAARKRELPRFPVRIGIVTSPSGAVIRDILQVLERRFQGLHVRLYPAQVQGDGAVEQVCTALRFFSCSNWAQVVILARGGGSLDDLWTFNEEAVARAIAACSIPVISAIGHETDFTIADFVADLRAPTPSAAAEMVICTRESVLEQIDGCRAKATQALRYRVLLASRALHERGTERAARLVHRTITRRAQRIDDLDGQLRRLYRNLLDARLVRLADLTRRLAAADLRLRFARDRHRNELLAGRCMKALEAKLWNGRRRQEFLELHLSQISPLAVLGRGYAIVQDASGRVVRSATDVLRNELLRIRLHRGELDAAVSEVRSDDSKSL
jgi:exodeoxyribonuclease VII large subunit